MGDNNPDENDPDISAAVDRAAIIMLGKDVRGDTGGDAEKRRRTLLAAQEICRRAGILETLQAIQADGELRPPPMWPQLDMVPVGGGPGWLAVTCRTFVQGRGIVTVSGTVSLAGGKRKRMQRVGEAFEKGKWLLKKKIDGHVQVRVK